MLEPAGRPESIPDADARSRQRGSSDRGTTVEAPPRLASLDTLIAWHGCGVVAIALEFADTSLELTVTNPVLVGPAARSSGGHGVIGMHERASLLGGTLDAEHVDGAFRVHARLPYTAHRR